MQQKIGSNTTVLLQKTFEERKGWRDLVEQSNDERGKM